MDTYLQLVTSAAVTAVACVLVVGACADMFALETGQPEPGGGPLVRATKFQGKLADLTRALMMIVITLTAAVYTGILGTMLGTFLFGLPFSAQALNIAFVLAIAFTIMTAGWIACLAAWVRRNYMQGV